MPRVGEYSWTLVVLCIISFFGSIENFSFGDLEVAQMAPPTPKAANTKNNVGVSAGTWADIFVGLLFE